jgi:hypothetical protein
MYSVCRKIHRIFFSGVTPDIFVQICRRSGGTSCLHAVEVQAKKDTAEQQVVCMLLAYLITYTLTPSELATELRKFSRY